MQSLRTTVLKSPKFPGTKSTVGLHHWADGAGPASLPRHASTSRDASSGSAILSERALGVRHIQKTNMYRNLKRLCT